jgi:antitoxin (DNA-binding transcriptional repressor) of toxin-antitoxin stability system
MCTQREISMMSKIGVREFREDLAAIMAQDEPVAVTRHGETVGFYIPVRRKPKNVDWTEIERLSAQVQEQLKAAGLTEDELVKDFERLRRAERRQRTERTA